MLTTMNQSKSELRVIAERLAALPPERQQEFVRRMETGGLDLRQLPLIAGARPAAVPLSFAQQRLWALEQLHPGTSLYVVPLFLELGGVLDVAALQRSLELVVARHEVLRTTFAEVDGAPVQVIASAASLDFELIDFSSAASAERERAAEAYAERYLESPFDLGRGPLFRARLVRLDAERHWLLIGLHHIVTDEWSNATLSAEVIESYAALRAGREPRLAPVALQYADHALWQRRCLSGALGQRQLEYWRATLGGEDVPLALPTDARPGAAQRDGAELLFSLDRRLVQRLHGFARSRSTTSFVVVLAAFQALLSKWCGQDEIRVGSPVAGRNLRELEQVVGFFSNTLVLKGIIDGASSFSELVERTRRAVADAQANQDLPFERLVEALRPERALNQTPLFQVMLSWHQEEQRAAALDGLTVRGRHVPETQAKFDIVLHVTDAPEQLTGRFVYRSALFSRTTLEQLSRSLEQLLEQLLTEPERPVGASSLLGAEQRAALLARAGEGRRDFERSVPQSIEKWAQERPEQLAIVHEAESLSYRELERRANHLAQRLLAAGIGAEDRVALRIERRPEFVIALLATMKCGAAYVPLDTRAPIERAREIVSDSGARLVLVASAAEQLELGVPTLAVSEPARGSSERVGAPVHSDQAAYVLYTSGSTGKPKGVVVTHGGLASYVRALLERLALPERASMAMVSTVVADLGNTVLFGALCSGQTLHLISEQRAFDAEACAAYLHEHQVDVLKISPSHLTGLLQAPRPAEALPKHALISGGEALTPELVQKLRALGVPRIVNHYGPTETTVGVLTFEGPADGSADAAKYPLGAPLGNSRVYVLDRELSLQAPGAVGELCIGGAGLARGYLGRPDWTAARFVPDPFGAPGARLYRSGDRGRQLPDGPLEFLGRIDDQIKIRGYRVELGEIRASIVEHPSVARAEVLAAPGAAGNSRLIAYLVPAGESRDTDVVRGALAARLPSYMVPADFVWLDSFPVTANGKLDRKRLPLPGDDSSSRAAVAPRNAVERALLGVWQEVLQRDVGVTDNFFASGGDSLLAFQVVAKARTLGLFFLPQEMFEHQTVAALAPLVRQQGSNDAWAVIEPEERGARAPLSFAQERLWFLWQLDPASNAYNVPMAVWLEGELDEGAMRRALERLVERHESLRTRIFTEDGRAYQRVSPTLELDFAVQELAGEGEARASVDEEASRPFDLDGGSLWRVRLLRLAPQRHILVVVLHHVISDGWSSALLVSEFVELYAAETENRPPALPALPIQYADYAIWQRRWLESGELDKQLAFWKSQLGSEREALSLPTDRPRPLVPSHQGGNLELELDAELIAGLRTLARAHDATLFMVLLTAWQLLLGRYSGQRWVHVGSTHANRSRVEVERVVGLFVNTQVFALEVRPEHSFVRHLTRVVETTAAAQANQDLPFEKLVEALNPERSLSVNPLFQVMFNHQRRPVEPRALERLQVREYERENQTTPFDLTLNTSEEGDALRTTLGYSAELFDRSTVQSLARHFSRLLAEIVRRPHDALGRLELLDEDERAALLGAHNATQLPFPREVTVPELFEAQVRKTPDAEALCFEGERLSYRELDRRANRVAQRLLELGATADSLVGVCLERSPSLVVALLGVLKAGAAYVPLDPDYPAERLRYMLADAAPLAVLTERRTLDRLGPPHAHLVCLDELPGEALERELPRATHAQHLAYCIYTSGSTGKPKGVVVSQGAFVNFLFSMLELLDIEPHERVLAATSLSFDIAGLELFLPLVAGGTIVMASKELLLQPTALAACARDERVTLIQATPSSWRLLLASGARLGELPARKLLSGGEALPEDLAEILVGSGKRVWNVYGPTETTVWSSSHELSPGASRPRIGRPIGNTQIHVLGAALELLPQGVTGELYIGGEGLARGYHGAADVTAARFVPDPWGGGGRIYRTGDLGRRLADGTLECLGRVDHQVKVRGHRIELGEIEARITEHASVGAAAVVTRADAAGVSLVAYVVPAAGVTPPDPAELRAHLSALLPDYMLPQLWMTLDALPLTPNGKLDRKALPAASASSASREYVEPRSPTAKKLAAIWRELLGAERVGLTDGFFELGGHSLLAVQVLARVEQELGVKIPVRFLFQSSSLGALAEQVEREQQLLPSEQDLDAILAKLDEAEELA